jgi:soluble lytic murein transglycosylase-like protein
MFQAELLMDHDLAVTIKLGLAFYLVMALLATPSAICSLQHQMPLQTARFSVLQLHGPTIPPEAPIAVQSSENATPLKDNKEAAPVRQEPSTPYDKHIIKASQTYKVEVALIKAVIMAESGYNPKAVSHKGAQGLMQLMPGTAKWLGVHDAFDPVLNIDGGVRYLRRLLDRFEGDVQLALAAYNAGSRYVRKYGGVPPFKATQIYIKKVMKYRKDYRKKLAVVDECRTLS